MSRGGQSFLAAGLEEFQRRAPEVLVLMLIREAFRRGISTRQVGRGVAIVTGKTVRAQMGLQVFATKVGHRAWTSSKVDLGLLRQDLDEAVQQFHEAPLNDDWTYLFLDGVN